MADPQGRGGTGGVATVPPCGMPQQVTARGLPEVWEGALRSEAPALAPRDGFQQPGHRGSNQSGMRAFNERLVLTLVRRQDGIAKAEIARQTGLSAQTVSVIMRQLESDGLLMRGNPMRGRIGQPSVPMSLDPRGAWFMGLKIGRRSADFVLTDFCGSIVFRNQRAYRWPDPQQTLSFATESIAAARAHPGVDARRIVGLGVAMPSQIWEWGDEAGAPAAAAEQWRAVDIRASLADLTSLPVYLQNDATAACGAELVFGGTPHRQDFVYFYVGTFVGGGVVLNGSLYPGRTGNAGALGSMPVPGRAGPEQLLDQASLVVLERDLIKAEIDPSPLWTETGDWSAFAEHAERWMENAARCLAYAIAASASVIDFEAAMIDGGFSADIRTRLVEKTARELSKLDLKGIEAPRLEEGTLGSVARALGGASLPLFDRYLIDQNTLMREG